jgi:secreted trypsin-like serine protease
MNRTPVIIACWFLLCVPAGGLVGDATIAEWTLARPTVMVFGSRGMCSGVVLTQDLVLTAAHCAAASGDSKIVGLIADKPYRFADVTEVAAHPQYTGEAGRTADLALLKLSKPLPSRFAPAFLSMRPVVVGERLIVVGYGRAEKDDNKTAGTPRMAMLTVSNQSATLLTLIDRGYNGKISGCYGDSGAPAFTTRGGVPALAGVVSGGSCGVLTYVIPFATYRDWIRETARNLGSALDP